MKSVTQRCIQLLLVMVGIACSFSALAAYQFTPVEYPGAPSTAVGGINNLGQAAGAAAYYTVDNSNPQNPIFTPAPPYAQSFVYDSNTQLFNLLPAAAGTLVVEAFAINDAGVVVGQAWDLSSPDTNGFIFDTNASAYTYFAHPGFSQTVPRAIGPTGRVTGFAMNNPDQTDQIGFIYDPAQDAFTDITFPGGIAVFAQGINGLDQIVGSVRFPTVGGAYRNSPPGNYGYLRDKFGTTLFRVNGLGTRARGINDAGLITGFVIDNDGVPWGFVATLPGRSGYQDVTVPATQLFVLPDSDSIFPQAINTGGRVAGIGNQRGFIATPMIATNRDQCNNGGWQSLVRANGTVFKSQGDCIKYVNTGK